MNNEDLIFVLKVLKFKNKYLKIFTNMYEFKSVVVKVLVLSDFKESRLILKKVLGKYMTLKVATEIIRIKAVN